MVFQHIYILYIPSFFWWRKREAFIIILSAHFSYEIFIFSRKWKTGKLFLPTLSKSCHSSQDFDLLPPTVFIVFLSTFFCLLLSRLYWIIPQRHSDTVTTDKKVTLEEKNIKEPPAFLYDSHHTRDPAHRTLSGVVDLLFYTCCAGCRTIFFQLYRYSPTTWVTHPCKGKCILSDCWSGRLVKIIDSDLLVGREMVLPHIHKDKANVSDRARY